MSNKNDGGPAFPVAADGPYIADCENPENPPVREFPGHPGMSLRVNRMPPLHIRWPTP